MSKSTGSALEENLKRLLLLRVMSLLGQALAIILVVYELELSLPISSICMVFILSIVWTVCSFFILRKTVVISDNMFFTQLMFDVVSLTAVLYLTGGATNPFAWFLLVPHSIASTILPRLYAWCMALITSAFYTVIVFFYVPIVRTNHPMEMGMGGHFQEHVIGMWLGFVLSAFLMAYFVAGMADSLRKRNRLLADMREKMFRDERLVALGTLATGAAHELGTPLGTMDIIAHELEKQFTGPNDSLVNQKLQLIQQQVKRCKNTLAGITETALLQKYDEGQVMPVDEYVQSLVVQWQVSHSEVVLHQQCKGEAPTPTIVSDLSLSHSIINMLDNAAQASPSNVALSLDWDSTFLTIVVEDRGAGLSNQQLAELGVSTNSSSTAGLGLGTYIAKASVERFGGDIRWINRHSKGLRVVIKLPLYKGGVA